MSVSARAALIAAVALCASAVTVAQSEGRAYQYNSQEGDDYDYEVEDLSGGAVAGIITGSIISLLVCVCLPLCCLLVRRCLCIPTAGGSCACMRWHVRALALHRLLMRLHWLLAITIICSLSLYL